jgi:hypothetical protein
MPPRLNWFFVVCFFACSVAAQAQVNVDTYVRAGDPTGQCSKDSSKKKAFCSHSGSDSEAAYYEEAIGENSFGIMRGYAYSEVTCIENDCTSNDGSSVNESIDDELSILGLQNEPTAFLNVEIVCLDCIKYVTTSYNELNLYDSYNHNVYCWVQRPQITPRCTATIPVVYENGQPVPAYILRVLAFGAQTFVRNGPAGAKVSTAVAFGINGGSGAYISASVVDAKGYRIKGVTVVGTSGHIYS